MGEGITIENEKDDTLLLEHLHSKSIRSIRQSVYTIKTFTNECMRIKEGTQA
jgi:hypothetical protein